MTFIFTVHMLHKTDNITRMEQLWFSILSVANRILLIITAGSRKNEVSVKNRYETLSLILFP